MTDRREGGPLPTEGATEGDTTGAGGPHTHPVSAPPEFAQETGTPRFAKGSKPAEQITGERELTEEERRHRSSAQTLED